MRHTIEKLATASLCLMLCRVALSSETATVNEHALVVRAQSQRHRRQSSVSLWQCPDTAASSRSSRSLAYLALYSARNKQDIAVFQARQGWSKGQVDRMLASGQFDFSKPTIIYTHGYTQTINRPWLKAIRSNFDGMHANKEPRFNLMFFDWSDYGARAYGSAASYVPYLGKLLSQFINDHLKQRYKYAASQIHIVSYSLSTHIAGQAGRKLKAAANQLGQITAIDPTGVCFHQDSQFADKYQLKPSDAKLVVARHYDMGKLGARRAIGGLDVFVNGGRDQPSMSLRHYTAITLLGYVSNHARASQHEAEQFDPSCQEIAYACSSYDNYLAGQCADCGPNNNRCFPISTLGNVQQSFEPKSNNYSNGAEMYMSTGRSQFCQHNYQVVAKLNAKRASKSDLSTLETGEFSFIVSDDESVRVNPRHKMGDKFTELLQLDRRISAFKNQINVENFNLRALQSVTINYMSHISPKERRNKSVRYCPSGNDQLSAC